jgi:hypothetical protein
MAKVFPGIDPYLEDPAFWEDFHRRFITELADYLLAKLPKAYDAHIDERVRLVEAEQGAVATRLPDVSVDQTSDLPATVSAARVRGATATLEPVSVPMLMLREQRDVWIEIVNLPERRLVTAIEVFSPTNKGGDGAVEYHAKRVSLYTRNVNIVELDLLRGGDRLTFAKPLPKGDYYVFVTRKRRMSVDVYTWKLRDPLPTIPVPLEPPDPDVSLELAVVFGGAYKRGRYFHRLRYDEPLRPPISTKDAAWAGKIARELERVPESEA